jgi:hypothetical protein
LDQTISRWKNVFRVDDAIGTHIDGNQTATAPGTFPSNEVSGFGGHPGYWEDAAVLTVIQDLLPG